MMIEAITFQLPEGMTRNAFIKNYDDNRDNWRGFNELIRKSYIYDGEARLSSGIYHWKTIATVADRWPDAKWRTFVKELYGSDQVVRRFEVPIFADNQLDKTITFLIDEVA